MNSSLKIERNKNLFTESRDSEYMGIKVQSIIINGDLYLFNCPLHNTRHSAIFKALRFKDGQGVASWIILKQYFNNAKKNYENERDALEDLDHESIIKMYDYSDEYLTLVIENGEKGDLLEILDKYYETKKINTANLQNTESIFIDEKIIRTIIKQIVIAIDYAYEYEKSYCHRDLKLENIVLNKKGKLILIDWGYADPYTNLLKFTDIPPPTDRPGSPSYMSPEIVNYENKRYCGHKSDIWSIGIIILTLYFGSFPFHYEGNSFKEIIDSQKKCPLYQMLHNFKWDEYLSIFVSRFGSKNKMSSKLNDLLKKIFQSEEKRITSKEFLNHEWMEGETVTNSELLKYFNC